MNYILHIDTSGDTGSVFIAGDGSVLSMITNTDSRNHAAVLNEHINTVLADAGISLPELSAIAVCGGPGSYTGLRISLSTAKGLCYVLDKPLMLHNKLELMALEQYYKHLSEYDVYTAFLPARDKEYFICSYSNKKEVIIKPRHIVEEEIPVLFEGVEADVLVTCTAGTEMRRIIKDKSVRYETIKGIDNSIWAVYALQQYNLHSFVNLSTSEPFYLKQVHTHNPKISK